MKTLIEVFNGLDYVSYAIGLMTAFLILLIRDVFLDIVAKGKEKKK